MKHFSQEYLERLQNEHRLVTAALINLKNNPRKYLGDVTRLISHIDEAVNKLESERVVLESKIDILNEFLNT